MEKFTILIAATNDGELDYRPIEQDMAFELLGMHGTFPLWSFTYGSSQITVYGAALLFTPVGENLEEIERRALGVLHLIE